FNDGLGLMAQAVGGVVEPCGEVGFDPFSLTDSQGIIYVDDSSYPELAENCMVQDTFYFGVCHNETWNYNQHLMGVTFSEGNCFYKIDVVLDQYYFENLSDAYITSVSNPVKYATFYYEEYVNSTTSNPITLFNVIVLDAHYTNGLTGKV